MSGKSAILPDQGRVNLLVVKYEKICFENHIDISQKSNQPCFYGLAFFKELRKTIFAING